jgi:hypothetical protein
MEHELTPPKKESYGKYFEDNGITPSENSCVIGLSFELNVVRHFAPEVVV